MSTHRAPCASSAQLADAPHCPGSPRHLACPLLPSLQTGAVANQGLPTTVWPWNVSSSRRQLGVPESGQVRGDTDLTPPGVSPHLREHTPLGPQVKSRATCLQEERHSILTGDPTCGKEPETPTLQPALSFLSSKTLVLVQMASSQNEPKNSLNGKGRAQLCTSRCA